MITKTQLRLIAALEIILVAAVIFLALLRNPADGATVQSVQTAAWQSASRWQIFAAMHALMLGAGGTLLALGGLLALWSPARWCGLVGMIGLFAYYRFEPRYEAATFITLVHAAALLLSGGMLAASVTRWDGVSLSPLVSSIVVGCLVVWSLVVGLLPKTQIEFFTDSLEARLKVTALVVAGTLMTLSFQQLPSLALRQAASKATAEEIRQRFFRLGRYFLLLMLVLSALILIQGGIKNLLWLPAIPFVPAFMAFYAPYKWFATTGATGLFSPEVAGEARSQFFLGVLFQYLSAGVFIVLYAAVRRRLSATSMLLGFSWLLLYWLPALWFAAMLSTSFD